MFSLSTIAIDTYLIDLYAFDLTIKTGTGKILCSTLNQTAKGSFLCKSIQSQ